MTDSIHPHPNPLPPPPEDVADPPRWVAEKKEGEGEKICRTQASNLQPSKLRIALGS